MTELCKKEITIKEENKPMLLIGYYNYTVILTYIGMFVGFTGILFATKDKIPNALLCLMVSGFCDMFDGGIASTRKRTMQEKRFGIQIDSLSDLICFGVLPALIVNSQTDSKLNLWICGVYVLCALIRLGYFNVDEEERQEKSDEGRKHYKGMPVTLMAIILPFTSLELSEKNLFVLAAASIAFLLPVEIKKPKGTAKIIMLTLGVFAFLKVVAEVL